MGNLQPSINDVRAKAPALCDAHDASECSSMGERETSTLHQQCASEGSSTTAVNCHGRAKASSRRRQVKSDALRETAGQLSTNAAIGIHLLVVTT